MAKNDPAYVRLVDRLARACQVDLESGWSIAGLDVMPFPEDDQPVAQNYVRNALARGTLEGCSKAEWEEVMEQDRDYLAAAGITVKPVELDGHYQEAHVVNAAETHRLALEASRGLSVGGGLSYKDDTVRRKRILAAQYAQEKGADADEVNEAAEAEGGDGSEESPNERVEAGGSGETPDGDEQEKVPARKTAIKKTAGKKAK